MEHDQRLETWKVYFASDSILDFLESHILEHFKSRISSIPAPSIEPPSEFLPNSKFISEILFTLYTLQAHLHNSEDSQANWCRLPSSIFILHETAASKTVSGKDVPLAPSESEINTIKTVKLILDSILAQETDGKIWEINNTMKSLSRDNLINLTRKIETSLHQEGLLKQNTIKLSSDFPENGKSLVSEAIQKLGGSLCSNDDENPRFILYDSNLKESASDRFRTKLRFNNKTLLHPLCKPDFDDFWVDDLQPYSSKIVPEDSLKNRYWMDEADYVVEPPNTISKPSQGNSEKSDKLVESSEPPSVSPKIDSVPNAETPSVVFNIEPKADISTDIMDIDDEKPLEVNDPATSAEIPSKEIISADYEKQNISVVDLSENKSGIAYKKRSELEPLEASTIQHIPNTTFDNSVAETLKTADINEEVTPKDSPVKEQEPESQEMAVEADKPVNPVEQDVVPKVSQDTETSANTNTTESTESDKPVENTFKEPALPSESTIPKVGESAPKDVSGPSENVNSEHKLQVDPVSAISDQDAMEVEAEIITKPGQSELSENKPVTTASESAQPAQPSSEPTNEVKAANSSQVDQGVPDSSITTEKILAEQKYEIIIPSYAAWFDINKIHENEKKANPEFFNGVNKSKNPSVYIEYRNFMINVYRLCPKEYLTVTACRRNLSGDVCSIMRVHAFLEQWGLINYQSDPELRPSLICPPYTGHFRVTAETPRGLVPFYPSAQNPAPFAVASSQQTDGVQKVPPSVSSSQNAFLKDPSAPMTTSDNIFNPVSSEANSSATPKQLFCATCGNECTNERYHCIKPVPQTIDLCPKCFLDGRFLSSLKSSDFVKLPSTSTTSYDSSGPQNRWSDQETLLLLEGIEMYDEDWEKVAEHVGTRSRDECVLHFLQLPIEDSTGLKSLANPLTDAGDFNYVPFSSSDNPIMSVVAFLASKVNPTVAAAASKAAIKALSEIESLKRSKESSENSTGEDKREPFVSNHQMQMAASVALSSAAAKAKILADREEATMQLLVHKAIELQMAKLEFKVKALEEMQAAIDQERNDLARQRLALVQDRIAFNKKVAQFNHILENQPGNPAPIPQTASSIVHHIGNEKADIPNEPMSLSDNTNSESIVQPDVAVSEPQAQLGSDSAASTIDTSIQKPLSPPANESDMGITNSPLPEATEKVDATQNSVSAEIDDSIQPIAQNASISPKDSTQIAQDTSNENKQLQLPEIKADNSIEAQSDTKFLPSMVSHSVPFTGAATDIQYDKMDVE
ncbi:hypothetical protein BB560_001649 [Smittium megazygosporum]|uniref:SWIRM-domain-containing protein n=1 Tax=Smittium megazygosporum TaxID=133381 RepID=A0A2T9ZH04_9FUNG|nr:hypothetical protein BB560_001651 [Smittium megazygosporum]PVV03875.1 hypothetical protein BB560_001649 [Smittium megazygosporum]